MAQPAGLLFSKDHEWVKLDGDVATIGITDYAQSSLGDIVYVELPRVGATLTQFAGIGVVESVKAVSDIFTPLGGEVLEINAALEGDPALVNRDPFGERLVLQGQARRRRREEQPACRHGLRQADRRGVANRRFGCTPRIPRATSRRCFASWASPRSKNSCACRDAVAVKAPLDLVPGLAEIEIAERFATLRRAHGCRRLPLVFGRGRLPPLRSAGDRRRSRCAASS